MRKIIYIVSVLFGSCLAWAQTVPVPAGHHKVFEFQTLPTSVQIYTCKAAASDTFAWSGPDPDAILQTRDKSMTLHHYKGPTWEGTDGSIVKGSNARHFHPAREQAVDWLELSASGGTQQFARIDFIHRIETQGGVAPDRASHACDATHAGEQVRVPYSATYEFYAP